MKFSNEIYRQVFPNKVVVTEKTESAVEGFTPTDDESALDNAQEGEEDVTANS